jgi:hypothetical protein
MAETLRLIWIGVVTMGILCMLQAAPAASQGKCGVIPHAPLLKTVLPGTANLEVAVYETEYGPGATRATSTRQRSRSMSCQVQAFGRKMGNHR